MRFQIEDLNIRKSEKCKALIAGIQAKIQSELAPKQKSLLEELSSRSQQLYSFSSLQPPNQRLVIQLEDQGYPQSAILKAMQKADNTQRPINFTSILAILKNQSAQLDLFNTS